MEFLRNGQFWYRAFKYTIYCLLAFNVLLFLREDVRDSAQTFAGGITLSNFVVAYSATVDTLAWVILLLLFELETAVIPDEKLRGSLKWVFTGIRAVCYAFITYSLYGYIATYGIVTNLMPFMTDDVCSLIVRGYSYVDAVGDYFPMTPEVCATMQDRPLQQIAGTQIIGTVQNLELARNLAVTDVVNASTWLVVVVTLEAEVWLQLKGYLTDRMLGLVKMFKPFLYAILLACAIYWGIDGEFLDFWDAFLWLVAFAFIELNIFSWHAETTAEKAAMTAAA